MCCFFHCSLSLHAHTWCGWCYTFPSFFRFPLTCLSSFFLTQNVVIVSLLIKWSVQLEYILTVVVHFASGTQHALYIIMYCKIASVTRSVSINGFALIMCYIHSTKEGGCYLLLLSKLWFHVYTKSFFVALLRLKTCVECVGCFQCNGYYNRWLKCGWTYLCTFYGH